MDPLVVRLAVAALTGLAVGIEREWSGHATGPLARFAGSPAGRAAREFGYLRQGLTPALRQALREQILETARTRLEGLAEQYLVAGRAGSALAALSNEEALKKANAELGEDTLEIKRV